MHIAILVTNTDESAFAGRHPDDGAKFAGLLGALRPDWRFSVFSVKDGNFPAALDTFDGIIVTGSPASVHDAHPWIARLLDVLRDAAGQGVPMFGACFGHQAIAMALGGTVGRNPDGWVLGLVQTRIQGLGPIRLYAAHLEQVTALPEGAAVVGQTDSCPIAAMRIGSHILTTQYHPEMTPAFIAALVTELDGHLPADVVTRARASLTEQADTPRIAAHIVAFLEAQDSAASRSIAVT